MPIAPLPCIAITSSPLSVYKTASNAFAGRNAVFRLTFPFSLPLVGYAKSKLSQHNLPILYPYVAYSVGAVPVNSKISLAEYNTGVLIAFIAPVILAYYIVPSTFLIASFFLSLSHQFVV